jgi:GT2 family glycosyltransferase
MTEPIETPRVGIVLVNWNGWQDTLECLESVFRLSYPNFCVIVCDNASTDGSVARIREWARGDLLAGCAASEMRYLTGAFPKPVPLIETMPGTDISCSTEKLILVQTGANRGFAGGSNVGIRLAIAAADAEFVWLLNNDTVVDPEALSHLVRRMKERPDAGICGSTILYYYRPRVVQALGGSTYNRWFARIGHIGCSLNAGELPDTKQVESLMRYVVGASMMVRTELFEKIGFLDERYFLYFEELDLATRAKGAYELAYSRESVVYHKEGASIGTSTLRDKRSSALAQQYASRNRILFTRTHFRRAIVTVVMATFASALVRLLGGRFEEFKYSLRGMGSGLLERRPAA